MPAVKKKLLDGIDQYSAYYSVICVFGSVVGCVVFPLIAQSIETIIFSAILLSLTAKTIHSRTLTSKDDVQEERRRGRDVVHEKKPKRKKVQTIPRVINVEAARRQREADLLKMEEQRRIEREQKLEEKRLKKAQKKEERLKRKVEEQKEKLRVEEQRRVLEEKRQAEKRTREKESRPKFPSGSKILESVNLLPRQRPVRRERKSSLSSVTVRSSTSSLPQSHTRHRNRKQWRKSRAASDSNLSPPLSLSPSPIPRLSSVLHTSLPWQPQIVCPSQDLSCLEGRRLRKANEKRDHNPSPPLSSTSSPTRHTNPSSCCLSTPPGQVCSLDRLAHSVAAATEPPWHNVGSHLWPQEPCLPPLHFVSASLRISHPSSSLWRPGPHSAPGNMTVCPPSSSVSSPWCVTRATKTTVAGSGGASPTSRAPRGSTDVSGTSCYSLFDGNGHSIFGTTLFVTREGSGEDEETDEKKDASSLGSSAGSSPRQLDGEPPKFDEWPHL